MVNKPVETLEEACEQIKYLAEHGTEREREDFECWVHDIVLTDITFKEREEVSIQRETYLNALKEVGRDTVRLGKDLS